MLIYDAVSIFGGIRPGGKLNGINNVNVAPITKSTALSP